MSECSCIKIWNSHHLYGDSFLTPTNCLGKTVYRIVTKPPQADYCCLRLIEMVARIIALCIIVPLFVVSIPISLIGLSIKWLASLCPSLSPTPLEVPSSLPPSALGHDSLPTQSSPPMAPGAINPLMVLPGTMMVPPPFSPFWGGVLPTKLTQPMTLGLAQENTFFDVDGPFRTVIAQQCKSQQQLNYACHLCLQLLSLSYTPIDEEIIRKLLLSYNYNGLPKVWNESIDQEIVNLSILAMEYILQKTFVFDYIEIASELACRFDTYFHGTSITALESIKHQGLIRVGVCKDKQEIQEIIGVAGDVFKHYQGQPSQCIYVAAGANTAFIFSKRSPEWYASFMETMTGTESYFKSHFYGDVRDTNKAMASVKSWTSSKGLPPENAGKVVAFAQKYWQQFATDTGAVLLIRRNRTRTDAVNDWLYDAHQLLDANDYRQALTNHMGLKNLFHYEGIPINDNDIPAKDITIFRIPLYRFGMHPGTMGLYNPMVG